MTKYEVHKELLSYMDRLIAVDKWIADNPEETTFRINEKLEEQAEIREYVHVLTREYLRSTL